MQYDVAPYMSFITRWRRKNINLLLPIHYYLLLSKNIPFNSSRCGFEGSHTAIKDDSYSAM